MTNHYVFVQVLSGLLASKEYMVSHSHGRLMTQRLVPAPVPAPRLPRPKAHGSVLVIGGSKGLGLAYAKHAAASGLQSLVIAARSPELPLDTLIALAEQGTPVWTVQYALAQASAAQQQSLSWLLHVAVGGLSTIISCSPSAAVASNIPAAVLGSRMTSPLAGHSSP